MRIYSPFRKNESIFIVEQRCTYVNSTLRWACEKSCVCACRLALSASRHAHTHDFSQAQRKVLLTYVHLCSTINILSFFLKGEYMRIRRLWRSDMADRVGQQLGNYRLIRLLGQG